MPPPIEPKLGPVLDSTGRALAFAARQEDLCWCAVGLVAALQGACLAALMGYDTARPEDILAPEAWRARIGPAGLRARSDPVKLAPLSLLLRRISSAQYLNLPERAVLSRAERAALEDLIALRNATLHHWPPMAPGAKALAGKTVAVALIGHLLEDHPAFDRARHAHRLSEIAASLAKLRG